MGPIDKAFRAVPRHLFLPGGVAEQAGRDRPLPIGFGQTNSQPSTVRLMLEWLEVEPGNKILDVGSGSGWTTALLAFLAGPKGRIYAVERIPELVEMGEANARRTGVRNIEFFQAGRQFGLAQYAPYDRILVSASADELPAELIEQLATGGKMVIPVRHDILEIEKSPQGDIDITNHSGFAFVPLVGDSS